MEQVYPKAATPVNLGGFNYNLEGLRGVAAISVVIAHAMNPAYSLDPKFTFTGISQYAPPAHLSVLVFFVLSGFVIGLTNKKPIVTNEQRWVYLKKRFVRLYPIYVVALVLTFFVGFLLNHYYSASFIGLNMLFLQLIAVPVPAENHAIWSLSFEVLYYLAFLLVSAFNWRPLIMVAACAILGIACSFIPALPRVCVAYLYGAAFWFVGLWIAGLPQRKTNVSAGMLIVFLLLFLCYGRMNLLVSLFVASGLDFNEHNTNNIFERIIIFSDFAYLLFCISLLTNFSGRMIKYQKILDLFVFSIPGLYLVAYIVSGKIKQVELFNTVFIPTVLYVLALICYIIRDKINSLAEKILSYAGAIGGVSYAIYVIHFPILVYINSIGYFSGSFVCFFVRFIVYMIIVFALSWWLEKKMQPKFKFLTHGSAK